MKNIFSKEVANITYFPTDIGDNPSQFRWRASWDCVGFSNKHRIKLRAYRVIRETPAGVWISKNCWPNIADGVVYWSDPYEGETLYWMKNDSGSSFAKPTRQSAIDSLIYRHKRWSSHILNDIIKFYETTNSLVEIFPEKADYTEKSLRKLVLAAQKGVR